MSPIPVVPPQLVLGFFLSLSLSIAVFLYFVLSLVLSFFSFLLFCVLSFFSFFFSLPLSLALSRRSQISSALAQESYDQALDWQAMTGLF